MGKDQKTLISWTELEHWLLKASACPHQRLCRGEDRQMHRHLAEWLTEERLRFPPGNLGSYPGFVGDKYVDATPRILYVAVNPGKYSETKWSKQRERLSRYHQTQQASKVFRWETDVVWNWDRNAKWQALFAGAGLHNWADVAFTNVCLCPTHNDTTPQASVMSRCVEAHLVPLVSILKPEVIFFLAMKNQESIFEPARSALNDRSIEHATLPHPARRGLGETAERLRQAISKACQRD